MPQAPRTDEATPLQNGLGHLQSALLVVQSSDELYSHATELSKYMTTKRHGVTAGFFLLVKADAAKQVLETVKTVTSASDRMALDNLDAAIDATLSCGGTALFFATSPFSGGVTAALGVAQGISCVKSVADLAYQVRYGESLFTGGMKSVEVGIDTVTTIASLATLGFHAGASGLRGLARSLLRRGPHAVSRWEQFTAAISLSVLGLSGVDAVVELTKGGETALPPTHDNVCSALAKCGLPMAPTACRPFPWQWLPEPEQFFSIRPNSRIGPNNLCLPHIYPQRKP